MPDINSAVDLDGVVNLARRVSAGLEAVPNWPPGHRGVAIITPGRNIVPIGVPPPDKVTPEMVAGVRGIVPEHPKHHITVIAYNDIPSEDAVDRYEANRAIPFLGHLMGMAYDGHTVIVFEGHPSGLTAGCRGAGMVLVDDAMAEHLRPDWLDVVAGAAPSARLLIFGRDGSVTEMRRTQEGPAPAQAPQTAPAPKRRGWWPFGRRR